MKAHILIYILIFFLAQETISQSKLEKVLESYKDSITDFGIVALVQYGAENIDISSIGFPKHIENPNQQLFCIGSSTKLFLTSVVFQLIDENKLSLDDNLTKFHSLKKLSQLYSEVSVLNLLNHSSGLPDYIDNASFNKAFLNPYSFYNDSDFMETVKEPIFQVGEKNKYSNSNYYVLRLILEEIEDKPLSSIIEERIIEPLRLTDTYTYYSNNIENLADPYANGMNLKGFPKSGLNRFTQGVGNFVTTARDLNVFIRHLFLANEFISAQSRKYLTNLIQPKEEKNTYYGTGTLKYKNNKYNLFGYSGRTISFSSICYIDIETYNSYILLLNSAEFSKSKGDNIIKKLIEAYQDKEE